MRRLLFVFAAVLALSSLTLAQDDPRKIRGTGEPIMRKLQQLEIYNHLLPLLLTGQQVKAIIPLIDAARDEDIQLAKEEIKVLQQLEPKLDTAIKAAKERQQVPSRELSADILKAAQGIQMARQIAAGKHAGLVLAKIKEVFDSGQLKIAANTYQDLQQPGQPELTQDQLLTIWINRILLETEAYPILVELSRQ
jgi:hypothetical protein